MKGRRLLPSGRKAIFFTLMSMIVVTLILLSITIIPKPRFSSDSEIMVIRVDAMNDFVIDLNDDLERATYIIGYTALLRMDEAIVTRGTYLVDVDAAFTTAFVNGTINVSGMVVLTNDSFIDYASRISHQASTLGITSSIVVREVELYMQDPWHVGVRLLAVINVTDGWGTAKFGQVKNITSSIPVSGFEDPVYSIESLGRISKIIIPTDITDYVNGGDTSDFKTHINASWYRNTSQAPTFIQRFEGNFSANPKGIESIVYLQEFIQQGLPLQDRSSVDHIYFSDKSHIPQSIINITDTPGWSWFRLDYNSSVLYGADHLIS